MEPERVNDVSRSQKKPENLVEYFREQTEQIKQSENITYQDVERILELQRQIYTSELSRDGSISNTVEKYLVAAAGITGGAALLSPILGPTAATVAALIVAAAYIFLNVNKTLPKSEKEGDQKDD